MIVKASEADRTAKNPPRGLVAALVFGPDSGLIRERAETLLKTVVEDLSDPFRVSDLDEQTLSNDPARLSDEAAAISMLGGRRVVRVRGAGNGLAKLFEAFLESPKGDALVVVEAGDLAKGSALRRVFEEADKAAAIPCYADSARDLSEVVRDALKAEGLSIASDALEDAVSRLGSDRGVTRRELEKLALYARGQKQVTLEDVRAAMGDEAEARIEEACDAAGAGDLARLDLALERLWTADVSPVAVLRLAMSHFHRLLLVGAESARGESLDGAMRKLRPPVHFSRASSFKAQAQRWSESKLFDALDLLLEGESLCKTTGVPAEAVCGRTLFNVAAMARMR
ncbi:MAG: DNA polymerase III subunit delta [Alphaproteobacteria bacterium]|nr:DNA polymerase III subunit delta [Alphaproteobacteria bacterium]MDE1985496.1 DNA polymerase III subunit delta [Alphaproteobacteria bacterium]MDE2161589.1 DNA polymerase III subunit delta [Alphaproteobacteria bacterium]MDE2267178.1 DNA polymerase III subunit delta [Alphaproteobacteria bacterium]MDE2498826.1 DNA polymerase III subunit delta [Alphaproteobacteria bacterium]